MVISPKPAPAPEPKVSQTDGEAAAAPLPLQPPESSRNSSASPASRRSISPSRSPRRLHRLAERRGRGHRAGRPSPPGAEDGKADAERLPGDLPVQHLPAAELPAELPADVHRVLPDAHCGRVVFGNNPLADKLRCHCINHRIRSQQSSDALARMFHDECNEKFNWFRCKFGYFFPSGTCGKGSAIAGHYSMVYPVNPSYSDPRDCQVYAARAITGPVAVPLAPGRAPHLQLRLGCAVQPAHAGRQPGCSVLSRCC